MSEYSIREYLTKPVVCKVTKEEEELRRELMRQLIEDHAEIRIDAHPQAALIREMKAKNVIGTDAEGRVTAIYPVSAVRTNKKVILEDGREAYAMCALDALGFHYTFEVPIRIESECSYCGEAISLTMKDGRVERENGDPRDIYVLCADLENQQNWSCCCCNIMHFFSCKEALQKWTAERDISSKYFALDLETANKLAWLLFSN